MFACQSSFKPIDEKKMQHVMFDMHLAEAYVQNMPRDTRLTEVMRQDSLALFYASILKKNVISEKEFVASVKWYAQYPERLDSIYQRILADYALLQVRNDK
jgi:hypothetical protein